MLNTISHTVVSTALNLPIKHSFEAATRDIIEDEIMWRARPMASASAEPRVVATRWRSLDQGTCEVSAATPADRHLVAIVLRNENVRFSLSGRVVHDGSVTAGALQVTEPGVVARCLFRGPYDVLHIHVPNALIAKFSRELSGCDEGALHSGPVLAQDPVAERLGRALLAAEETGGAFGQLYADCITTAIVSRLLAPTRHVGSGGRPKIAELARWRLRRVTEYVEANLAESVSLADLASAAGLTRMHFAAQFRAATGLPPHEYLLRRRIERAQEMLIADEESLVEIALAVGFQTQSHFTSVFKRFVGQPPRAWRQCYRGKAPARDERWDCGDEEHTRFAA
jgi:AraC family transcriptional regulator